MKEKMFFRLVLVAGAVTMLTACTSESENGPSANISYETVAAAQQVPVTFGTYIGDQATTRAGTAGNITSPANLAAKGGFGVLTYYTNGEKYAAAVSAGTAKPNFMYNQAVTSGDEGVNWTYSPKKYWPNETTNDSEANNISSHSDYLSFFAYAPHVTPAEATGITSLSGNNVNGDPTLTYKLASASPITVGGAVDLLWGVAGTSTNSVNPTNNTTPDPDDATQEITAGLPLLNQTKQATNGKVSFAFRHALSSLKLTVQGAYDVVIPSTETIDPNTHINIESVSITSNLPTVGVLNLNNTTENTPLWTSLTTAADLTFSLPNESIVSTLQGPYADGKYGVGRGTSETDYISTKQQVIASDGYFVFLPNNLAGATANATFNVTIHYYVQTTDAALYGGYSRVENTITKSISFPTYGGKQYTLNMILGMTSVKLGATVSGWDVDPTEHNIDLPKNNN